mmetsp:Transcript_50674/g.162184  ORF Transcript_50674/g.162184 Transcript_50674/m.162184 type:complete len:400 (+) Transcript_50674:953-2152(+)
MVTPDDMIAFMESQVALRIKMEPQESETAAYDAAWGAAFDGWMAPFKGQEAAAGEQAGEGQQEDRPPARALVVHAPGRQLRLELMSSSPRVFLCRDFLSPAECDAFVALGQQVSTRPHAWTNLELGMRNVVATGLRTKGTRAEGREGKLVALLEERVAALTGLPPGSQGERIQLSFSAPEAEASKCSIGLHVDANHQKHHRWATVLVYLNTLPQGCGGETVFPCAGGAGTEPARDAATQLFGAGLRKCASGGLAHLSCPCPSSCILACQILVYLRARRTATTSAEARCFLLPNVSGSRGGGLTALLTGRPPQHGRGRRNHRGRGGRDRSRGGGGSHGGCDGARDGVRGPRARPVGAAGQGERCAVLHAGSQGGGGGGPHEHSRGPFRHLPRQVDAPGVR